jgi:hypothetical protein
MLEARKLAFDLFLFALKCVVHYIASVRHFLLVYVELLSII